MNYSEHINSRQIGAAGEDKAVSWLLKNGYSLVSRNYRKRSFEVDIVVLDLKGVLRFIEVKTVLHGTEDFASYSIENRNIARYFKAVECFLADHPEQINRQISMDAIIVHNDSIKYYQNITSTHLL